MTSTEEEISDKVTRFKEKHSLDSDEEDENVKYDVLAEDDIEGQEEATIEFDENIQITPFNMREELEEGHFDSDGTYIFDKSKEIHDNWIDNIDWVKVKHLKPEELNKKRALESDSESEEEGDESKKKADTIRIYEEILSILQAGETIGQAIRRLAKNKLKIPSARQTWRNKKMKTLGRPAEVDQEGVEMALAEQKQMLYLTELSDRLVQDGIIEIYDTPYERLAFTLKQLKGQDSKLTLAESMKDDDVLDMFAEDFDSKEAQKIKGPPTDTDPTESSLEIGSTDIKEPPAPDDGKPKYTKDPDGVLWEYKTTNSEDAEIKGPFTTLEMITWSEDGTFGSGVFCRKYQSHSQFYHSMRMDFDLYQ